MQLARYYRLATDSDFGVRCNGSGLFIGATPLLERAPNRNERPVWRPRPLADVNRDLSQSYGMPIAFAAKLGGVASIAWALDRGDLAHAQVTALLLRLPDPPILTKGGLKAHELAELAARLEESGLLSVGDGSSRPSSGPPALNETEASPIGKFNPYHDVRGRFTTADSGVEQTEDHGARSGGVDVVAGETPQQDTHRSEQSRGPSSEAVVHGTRPMSLAAFAPLSCSDAFPACAQIAAFQRPTLISNCIAALRTCKSTGLPTIFGPGVVGVQ